MAGTYLGELEQLLLLAILRLGDDAYAVEVARELEHRAARHVSRGALYTSFDRLETKGLIRWKLAAGSADRDGLPRRRYSLTSTGLATLRESRDLMRRMWRGLDSLLNEPLP